MKLYDLFHGKTLRSPISESYRTHMNRINFSD